MANLSTDRRQPANAADDQGGQSLPHPVWDGYRNNFARHLIGTGRHLQSTLMHTLTDEFGHRDLKIGYEPYISMLGRDGYRLTDVANWMAISKQACNQTANQIEKLGYIKRLSDPSDGRAKLLVLTDLGEKLVRDGASVLQAVADQYAGILSPSQLDRLAILLVELATALALPRDPVDIQQQGHAQVLGALLPRLSTYMQSRLMTLTRAKGHPQLAMGHGQVLTLIGPGGGRIQQIARIQEVSKQAINTTANSLEQLGYIARKAEPVDGRATRLVLTDRGVQLLADSVTSVDQLEEEFAALIGKESIQELKSLVEQLYAGLHLEEDIFSKPEARLRLAGNTDVRLLAQRLKQQLQAESIEQLVHYLQEDNEQ